MNSAFSAPRRWLLAGVAGYFTDRRASDHQRVQCACGIIRHFVGHRAFREVVDSPPADATERL